MVKPSRACPFSFCHREMCIRDRSWGAEAFRYYNEKGYLQFHRDGALKGEFVEGEFPIQEPESMDYTQQVLRLLEFEGDVVASTGTAGEEAVTTVVVQQSWKGAPLFRQELTLSYKNGCLVQVEGRRLNGEPELDPSREPISIPTTLFQFYHGVTALGDVLSLIHISGQCGAERTVIAMDLTERTLESHSIFEGKIVTLLVDQAELPDGKRASREVVLHPGGVAVLPPDEEGNVTLVQQYRYPLSLIHIFQAQLAGIGLHDLQHGFRPVLLPGVLRLEGPAQGRVLALVKHLAHLGVKLLQIERHH